MEPDTFFQLASFEQVLDDLSCRFIVNIPPEELVSVPRICFQIEQAHWFYEDFVREQNPHRLPSLSLRKFSKCIFDHCPLLWQYSGSHEEEFEDFLRYKKRVPVLGGILLDENWEKCILVKGWKGSTWSFPRGKINKDEPDVDCAIREVYEETGYDISPLILPDAFLELQIKEQRVKLYIIPGVPTETPMSPKTRKEISSIGWIHLADLPGYSKKNKHGPPGIKLYMVTPFTSGLRKWVSQNRHMKGKLIPVEEEGSLEDAIQDEVVQNGTTDDLIAMLRRQQPYEQEVDLLGMLRNGNNQLYSQMSSHPIEPYLQGGMSYMFQQSGNGQQGSDLMEFSPKIEPTRDSVQPPPPPINPTGPVNQARQESLLNILKGGAPKTIPETKPSNPSPLDILKSPQSRPLAPASPPKSQHQQNLLSMLKSPQLSSTTPPIQNPNPLSSVKTQRTEPRSQPKSPPARPTLPSTESHQHALLATLKSNPNPPNPPQSPLSKPPPAPDISSHQNSLLSALKSPKLEAQTNHKTSLLAALNKPPPPSNPSPTPVSTPLSETAPTHQTTASSLLAGIKSPPVPRAIPTPAHQTSLLSALKSPTLQATTSTVPAPSTAHTTSLLSAFKNPPTAPSPVEKQGRGKSVEKPSGEVKNVHMESLLKTLTSPSTSPVMEKIIPKDMTSEVPSAQTNGQRIPRNVPLVKGAKEGPEAPKVGLAATGSDRVNSLLSALKGQSGQVESNVPQSPVNKKNRSTNDKKQPLPPPPEPNSSTKPSVPSPTLATLVKTPPSKVTSLLDTLKGKSTTPTSPPTPPTAHQKSLLSVLNPSSPRTQSPASKPSPKPQQFNFSPTPQVGKRIKFRETLVAGGGIKEFQPERKTNGNAIDLGKVTLLRRPTPEPAASPTETTPEGPATEDKVAKQTETRAVTDVREDSPRSKQSVAGKEDSVNAREITPEPRLSLPTTAELSQSNTDNVGTIHTETGAITVLKRPESLKTEPTPLENKPESPLGIEFPFRRRTPSKDSRGSPTPTTTPTRAHSQSLLALLKGPPAEVQNEENVNGGPDVQPEDNNNVMSLDSVEPSEAVEERVQSDETEESKENLGTEREMKLVAMLERALSRGLLS